MYFACMVQVRLGGLHSADEVRRWLITQRTARLHLIPSLARKHRAYLEDEARNMQSRLKGVLNQEAPDELADLMLELHTQHIPSLYSALLLVAPVQLLNWSLASLLVGVGIYYGLIFTNNLGNMQGLNANLALLLVYTLFTATALASFMVPDLLKLTETNDWAQQNHSRLKELLHQSPNPRSDPPGLHVASSSSPPPPQPHQTASVDNQAGATSQTNLPADDSAEANVLGAGGRGRWVKSVNLTRGRVLAVDETNMYSLEGMLRITAIFNRLLFESDFAEKWFR